MRLYAIHSSAGAEVLDAPERAMAARTGFSVAALVFGPLWLVARGLWLALIVYALAAAAVFVLVRSGFLWPGAGFVVFALGQLYLGVEGRALAVASRALSGRPLIDVIYARSALEAERVYLERALPLAPAPVRRGSARPGQEIIGLFPEAER